MSKLEDELAFQLKACGLPKPVREYQFHPHRKWRFDFAWPGRLPMVAVEVEGGIYSGGRHTRGSGFEGDCDKYNAAQLMGWLVLRVGPTHIKKGFAVHWIEQAINQGRA